jgi:hypothetical protein
MGGAGPPGTSFSRELVPALDNFLLGRATMIRDAVGWYAALCRRGLADRSLRDAPLTVLSDNTTRRSDLMKWIGTKNLGMLLLGIWLIATGVLPFVSITFVNMGLVLAVLAIATGVLILLGR